MECELRTIPLRFTKEHKLDACIVFCTIWSCSRVWFDYVAVDYCVHETSVHKLHMYFAFQPTGSNWYMTFNDYKTCLLDLLIKLIFSVARFICSLYEEGWTARSSNSHTGTSISMNLALPQGKFGSSKILNSNWRHMYTCLTKLDYKTARGLHTAWLSLLLSIYSLGELPL